MIITIIEKENPGIYTIEYPIDFVGEISKIYQKRIPTEKVIS